MTTKHLLFSWLNTPVIALLCLLGLAAGPSETDPPISNTTFQEGEYLKFRLHYGLITAGHAVLEVKKGLVEKNGRPCLHVVGTGWSTPAFDKIFRVRDRYETYMDAKSLESVYFTCKIDEGDFSHYHEVDFDPNKNLATYLQPPKPPARYGVPDKVRDILSVFFYARAKYDHKQLTEGEVIKLQNFYGRKNVDLKATLMKREVLKVGGRKYRAMKFSLNVEEAGMITDGGKIHFWMTDDANKIPVRIKCDLMIGSIKIDLEQAKGLRNPVTALVR